MSPESLLMTEEPENNYGNENEEAFKEEFNHPADGALHWLVIRNFVI